MSAGWMLPNPVLSMRRQRQQADAFLWITNAVRNCIASSKLTICAEIKQNAFGKKRVKSRINHTHKKMHLVVLAFFFERRWGFHYYILFYLTPTAKWLKSISKQKRKWSGNTRQRHTAEVLRVLGPQPSIFVWKYMLCTALHKDLFLFWTTTMTATATMIWRLSGNANWTGDNIKTLKIILALKGPVCRICLDLRVWD